ISSLWFGRRKRSEKPPSLPGLVTLQGREPTASVVPPWFAGPSRSAALQAAAQRKGAAGTAGRGNGRTRRRLGPKGFARAAPRPSSAPRCLPGSTAAGSLQGSKSAYSSLHSRCHITAIIGEAGGFVNRPAKDFSRPGA